MQVTAAHSHPQELALKSQKLPGLLYLGYKKHTLNSRNNSFKHKCVFLLHKPGLLLFVIISWTMPSLFHFLGSEIKPTFVSGLSTNQQQDQSWIGYLHWVPTLGCTLGITNTDPAQHLNFLSELKYFCSCQERLELLRAWFPLSPHQCACLQDVNERDLWTWTNLDTFMVSKLFLHTLAQILAQLNGAALLMCLKFFCGHSYHSKLKQSQQFQLSCSPEGEGYCRVKYS